MVCRLKCLKPGGDFILLEATVLCYLLQCRLTTEKDIDTEKSELAEPWARAQGLRNIMQNGFPAQRELKLSTEGSRRANAARGSLGSRETKAVQHLPNSRPRAKPWVVASNANREGEKLQVFTLDIKHNLIQQRLLLQV